MIIGVKYYARGAAVPGSWTDLDVAECEADFIEEAYDEGTAPFSGVNYAYWRSYYTVRLVIDPLSFGDTTYGPIVTSLRTADFIRIKDTRYSWLGDANTIDFIRQGSNQAQRFQPSLLTRYIELNLKEEEPH